ncbi:hypothetical protein A2837_01505 [Candidatus Kaiserbacteria bacterium RIFCSPHIGHO2_01_FULL_46_22]|uniref:Large ribosomal subunit protein bL25 n=1 Tax=Candidatus Kaiserbacteria bacterium RIFCSPHIGHO2_01_FULL_46_22 TaxID=1798475 RepID=A0A1F6BY91_9BACT|nr:MAG: hypothetical protein A2837_01505 [Candidatus Kaiserbacteria bacterium RIFCSPHIGHO2_01_FULL_46_22]
MTIKLNVVKRTETGKKLDKLRANGKLPAVVYGAKEESTPLSLDRREFEKAYEAAGESSIIVLTGLDEDKEVLVHDMAFNAVKGGVQHVDFYAVEKGKEVTVPVELTFVGEAPAIKLGGSLTKALHEIEVTAKPANLPHEIIVDINVLNTFEDHIRVKDLNIPSGVKVENDPEDMVAVVTEAKEEPVEEVTVDMAAIEVEQKGKKEDEEEAA